MPCCGGGGAGAGGGSGGGKLGAGREGGGEGGDGGDEGGGPIGGDGGGGGSGGEVRMMQPTSNGERHGAASACILSLQQSFSPPLRDVQPQS